MESRGDWKGWKGRSGLRGRTFGTAGHWDTMCGCAVVDVCDDDDDDGNVKCQHQCCVVYSFCYWSFAFYAFVQSIYIFTGNRIFCILCVKILISRWKHTTNAHTDESIASCIRLCPAEGEKHTPQQRTTSARQDIFGRTFGGWQDESDAAVNRGKARAKTSDCN